MKLYEKSSIRQSYSCSKAIGRFETQKDVEIERG